MVQTSSYKISHGDVMYNMVTLVNNTVLCICKRKDLKRSHHRKKYFVTMYGDGFF